MHRACWNGSLLGAMGQLLRRFYRPTTRVRYPSSLLLILTANIFGPSINPSTDFTVNNGQTGRIGPLQVPSVIHSTKFVASAAPQTRAS